MAARLKVFVTSNGFTESAVAVSSRPKALEAWGVSQDLFKEGSARETEDPELVKAALAEPGKVIERQAASRAELARIAPAPKKKAAAKARPAEPARPPGPSKAALKRVADLEAELKALAAAHDARLAGIAAEREALDRREARARSGYDEDRKALEARLEKAKAVL